MSRGDLTLLPGEVSWSWGWGMEAARTKTASQKCSEDRTAWLPGGRKRLGQPSQEFVSGSPGRGRWQMASHPLSKTLQTQ